MVERNLIVPSPEIVPPSVPMDYDWARVRMHFNIILLDFLKINAVLSWMIQKIKII